MFYKKEEETDFPDERHRLHQHDHHRYGKRGRGLYSGRKLSSAELQLLLLSKQPSHGYELIKLLRERSDGFYVPSPDMIYPALTYLEDVGHASVQVEGNRKLYQMTRAGKAHLRQNQADAERMLADLERIGAQMANARQAFEAGADDGDVPEELEAARQGLRRAVREREPFTPDEAKRIAAILQQAATQIRETSQR